MKRKFNISFSVESEYYDTRYAEDDIARDISLLLRPYFGHIEVESYEVYNTED